MVKTTAENAGGRAGGQRDWACQSGAAGSGNRPPGRRAAERAGGSARFGPCTAWSAPHRATRAELRLDADRMSAAASAVWSRPSRFYISRASRTRPSRRSTGASVAVNVAESEASWATQTTVTHEHAVMKILVRYAGQWHYMRESGSDIRG